MALQADANWHGESGRALLNPLVEDRNGWFGVRLLQVQQARAAEDLAAEGAKLRVQVTYRGSAIVTFLLGSSFRKGSQLNLRSALLPLLRIGLSDRDDLRA